MAEHSPYVISILTLMTPLGDVRAKRMFGGYGLFLDDCMFALISRGEELFLKADDGNRDSFGALGRQSHGKMPYYSVPEGALGDWGIGRRWSRGRWVPRQPPSEPKSQRNANLIRLNPLFRRPAESLIGLLLALA